MHTIAARSIGAGAGIAAGAGIGVALHRSGEQGRAQADQITARMHELTGAGPDAPGQVSTSGVDFAEATAFGNNTTPGSFNAKLNPDEYDEYLRLRSEWPQAQAQRDTVGAKRAMGFIGAGLVAGGGAVILAAPSVFKASARMPAQVALAGGLAGAAALGASMLLD